VRKQIQALQVTYLQTAATLRNDEAEARTHGSTVSAASFATAASVYETVAADLQKIGGGNEG
jgi:hypothetical protein